MMKSFLPILLMVTAAAAGNIVTSKDSLWIYNNSHSGRWTDSVTIVNNGPQGVRLDSVRMLVTGWDSFSLKSSITEAEARMAELHHGVQKMRYGTIDSVDATGYRLDFSPGMSPGDSLFAIGPSGDSAILCNLQIGYCFSCGLEKYPRYLTGSLLFYFSNGQVVGIRIYTDDLRPTGTNHALPVRLHVISGNHSARYLINGQLVTDKAESCIRRHNVHRLINR